MADASKDAEFWRGRFVALVWDEKAWQAELERRREAIAAQAEQLAAAQRSHAALEAARQQLADQIEALRLVVDDREREIWRLFGEVSKAHRQLNEVWASFSWRATIPLRSISARVPSLARGLRGVGQRHPYLWKASLNTIRGAGRMLLLRSPVARAPALPLPEPAPPVTPAFLEAPAIPPVPPPGPNNWLFLGDTVERHAEAPQGVESGSLTVDVLVASLHTAVPLLPCAWAPTQARLVALPLQDLLSRLVAGSDLASLPATEDKSPVAGDHVLFTGAVRTSPDRDLLESLTGYGIAFSLILHDVEALLELPQPGESHVTWLRLVLTHARCVFVGDAAARDLLLRWAALSDISVYAAVSVIEEEAGADRHRLWPPAYDAMAARIAVPGPVLPPQQPGRIFLPGILPPEPLPTLASAQAWCTDGDPQVSILIVNRNALQLTRACVQQIWANTSGVRYEIIIVDNGSSPAECRALSALGRGTRLLPLGTDRFFGEACNIAAEQAQAPLLCLLGNECFGQPGWLNVLVEVLERDPTAGAAGPLLLSPDLTVRDSSGSITEQGFPTPVGQYDETQFDDQRPRPVDYVSAAALLIRRDAYLRAGGLDLMYEPGSYEDVDLCFKLGAFGLGVRSCPSAHAIYAEADQASPAAAARRRAIGELNRSKFVSRWSSFLRSRSGSDLAAIKQEIFIDASAAPADDTRLATAALYTPYAITPGGGERFLLTIASELMRTHRVTIVTPHPYSQLRLQGIAHTFGIDLSRCLLQTETAFAASPTPDLMVVLGNYIYPPVLSRTPNAVFICQFPFPFPIGGHPPRIDTGYRAVIAYSDYARSHILAAMSAHQMPDWPVEILYPPVPQVVADRTLKRPMVLTVGRFFTGGHNKRHDLMIDAFRQVLEAGSGEVELHLAGSSTPGPDHMHYLETLMQAAEGLPITFHVNASRRTLEDLSRRAAVYWHATGLGGDLTAHPEMAEHFGISLVEAMSAECVPLAFNAGGPREIITPGVDGFLYGSIDELVRMTIDILRPESTARRHAIGRAAGERARVFAPERFAQRVREILLRSTAG